MADLRYTVDIDTTSAERSLDSIQKRIGALSDTFLKLRTVIASVSLGNLITEATTFASEIKKVSAATNISIGSILGFTRAVQQNGGTLDNAQDIVYEFVNALGEAAAGAADVQKAFRDAGVSIGDLGKLTEQDLFAKTIDGISKITDASKRAYTANKLFGESWQGINLQGLGAAYGRSAAEGAKYASAIQSAAAAQSAVKSVVTNFQIALLAAIKPLTDLAARLDIGITAIQKFIQALLAMAAAFGVFKLISGAIALIRALWVAGSGLATAFADAGTIVVNFVKNFGAIITNVKSASSIFSGLRAVVSAVASTIGEALAPAFGILKNLAGPALLAVAGYWGYVQENTQAALDKLLEYADALTFGVFDLKPGPKKPEEPKPPTAEEEARRKIINEAANTLGQMTLEYRQQADDLYLSLFNSNSRLATEAKLLSLSEDQQEILRAQLDIDDQRIAKVRDLQNQIAQLQLQQAQGSEDPSLAGRIALLQKQIPIIENIYKQHAQNLPDYIRNLQIARNLEDQRLKGLEAERGLRDALRGITDQQRSIEIEANANLSPLQKQIEQIRLSSEQSARAAKDAFVASFGDASKISDANFLKMVAGVEQIDAASQKLANDQINQLQASRSWANGWKGAFGSYVDEATNAAKAAERVFAKATQGMEDAIVSFAKTGKFEWKGFVASLAEELLRSQVRQLMAQMFSSNTKSSGGSIMDVISSAGKLLGFANGGIVPHNGPILVGERGPEIISGVAGRNVIPNEQLGGTTVVNYNINAVDALSFKQMIARDPAFIHAVATQGGRALPQTRR